MPVGLPVGVLVGALAGALNANFALEGLLAGHDGIGRRAVSELSVPGSEWSWVFRVGDGSSALLVGVLAVLLVRRTSGRRPRVAAGWLLLVTAATSLVAALVPLACAATAGARCAASPGAAPPWHNVLHDDVSIAGTTTAILAALLLAVAARGRRRATHATAGLLSLGLGLGLALGASGALPGWFGWVQRTQVVVLSVWFVAVGAEAARGPVTASALPAKAPDGAG